MKLRLRIIQPINSPLIKHFYIEIDEVSRKPNLEPIFNFDTNGNIHTCIKQLEPIKIEIMQLCKELYDKNCEESSGYIPSHGSIATLIMINWDKQIIPLLRQHKIQNLLNQ